MLQVVMTVYKHYANINTSLSWENTHCHDIFFTELGIHEIDENHEILALSKGQCIVIHGKMTQVSNKVWISNIFKQEIKLIPLYEQNKIGHYDIGLKATVHCDNTVQKCEVYPYFGTVKNVEHENYFTTEYMTKRLSFNMKTIFYGLRTLSIE